MGSRAEAAPSILAANDVEDGLDDRAQGEYILSGSPIVLRSRQMLL